MTDPVAPSSASGAVGLAQPVGPSIGREMAKGAAWMVLMRLAIRAIGLVSTVVLARLLVPDDFGLIALSTNIVLAVETLGQFSLDVALIRDAKATRAQYDTAWTLSVIRGWLTALLVILFAVPMGQFFLESRLPFVLYALAVATVVEGYQNIGIVDLRKNMQFRREFNFMLLQKIVSFVVTIVFAVALREYWALLAGIVLGRISGTVLSYFMSSYRPRHCLSEWRPLLNFSKWLLINNILFLLSRMDVYVVGRYFGAHELGVYNVSVEIASLPSTELVAPIQRAIYPGFTRLAANIEQLKKSYVNGLSILVMLALPASTGIAVLAEPLVRVLLGLNWLGAIPLLQILSLNGLIRLGSGNAGSVLIAIGRPKAITALALLNLAMLGPSLAIGINLSGLTGAAWALVVTSGFGLVLSYTVICKNLHISVLELVRAVWRNWGAAAIMAITVHLVTSMPWLSNPMAQLVIGVPTGVLSYVGSLLGLWIISGRPRGAEQFTLTALRQFLDRRNATKPGVTGA